MLGSGVLSAGFSLLFWSLGRGSCLLSDGITFVYHCRVVAFLSMKTALGEDSANMLEPCVLDTCRRSTVLCPVNYSLRLCPVLGFLRVGIDFPPPDAWAENMGCQAPRSGPEVQ